MVAASAIWSRVAVGAANDCWPWTGKIDVAGYGRTGVRAKSRLAHRNAWEVSNGRPVPDGLDVLHRCDNRRCCNPGHLFLGTHQDNMADRNAKGRQARLRGEASTSAKLTAAEVADIRARLATDTQASLAREYGVNKSTIHLIKTGRNWPQ